MKLHILKISLFLFVISLILLASCNSKDVSDVRLNENLQYLGINDTLRLTTVIKAPEDKNNPVIWTSDNENIVEVSANGVVRAISEGSTVVVARAGNKSASCEIHVNTYKFDMASYTQTENEDIPEYSILLTKNISYQNSNEGTPRGTVSMRLNILGSPDYTDLFSGKYNVTDGTDVTAFTILSGKQLDETNIDGSFIDDKYLSSSVYLIVGGNMSITNLKDQYVVTGNFLTKDLSGTDKEISFIYTGNISKVNPREILNN